MGRATSNTCSGVVFFFFFFLINKEQKFIEKKKDKVRKTSHQVYRGYTKGAPQPEQKRA